MKDELEDANPMKHPEEESGSADGSPKFGRLLIVLALAVAFVGFVTWASQAWLVG
ncbi:hypothetical protein [Lacisediminimonas sp.]|uniref:hypothetical protein n=1 Tax=Lacisediminimonas sp. TaxID=3060582 RepID=UPI002721149E|nr:hypothetical protein [Lacisediminimonas sp.]MDO8301519.1 hypothetical protein [Lacisediminimonas sp.]